MEACVWIKRSSGTHSIFDCALLVDGEVYVFVQNACSRELSTSHLLSNSSSPPSSSLMETQQPSRSTTGHASVEQLTPTLQLSPFDEAQSSTKIQLKSLLVVTMGVTTTGHSVEVEDLS